MLADFSNRSLGGSIHFPSHGQPVHGHAKNATPDKPSTKPQPDDRKQHVLQHVNHDRQRRRQQLRPRHQIRRPLLRDIHLESAGQNPPDDPAGHDLARPRDARGPEGEGKRVGIVRVVEREVWVEDLIRPVVEDEDLAEESEHGGVLGDAAEEDVAGGECLVRGVVLTVEAEEDEKVVEAGRQGEWGDEDEEGGGEELEDGELGGGAEAGVEGADVGLVGEHEVSALC